MRLVYILHTHTHTYTHSMVYEKLFQLVPNVASIFTKPRQEMAIKMGNMLEMLVSCASEPDNMKQQLMWLGLRHVNYNVKPRHLPLMGPVLMAVLSEGAGEHWTSTVERAWDTLWKLVMETMSESLADGLEYGERSRRLIELVREKATATTVGHLLLTALSSSCPAMVHAFCNSGTLGERIDGDATEIDADKASSDGRISVHSTAPSLPAGDPERKLPSGTADEAPGSAMGLNKGAKNDTSIFLSPGDAKGRTKGPESVQAKAMDGGESTSHTQAHLQVTPAKKAGKKTKHKNEEQARALGNALWAFVIECTDQLYEPERQLETIFVFGSRNFKHGMRSEHLKAVGKALEAVFQLILQGDEWSEKSVESWNWLWRIISTNLGKELEALETGMCDVVITNWNTVKGKTDIETLGQRFWTQLNNEAPEQTHIFRRPLKMWGTLLHHIMDMLIVSIQDPESFFELLFELTVRHIRYGVRPEYLQPFGTALFAMLEELLGDEWNERAQQAWKLVWKRASDSIARGLNVGGNAITYALVSGKADAMHSAVMDAPRQDRAEWLCCIKIDGVIISPLYWALHDGKVDITEFILQDLLTIRADLHGYYYGRSTLFAHHKDLVHELAKECPRLLKILMDGLLWHSKEKLPGRLVRVNYYIKDIYGDPDEHEDPWNSPLAHLVAVADNDTFKHPAVRKVLDLKWRTFGLKMFCLKEAWFILHLIFFMYAHVGDPSGCRVDGDWSRSVLECIASVTLVVAGLAVLIQIKQRKYLECQVEKENTFYLKRTHSM
jgi:hemoglobin-like flavoprotein